MTLSGSKPNLLSAGRFVNRAIGDDTGYNPREDDRIYRGTRVLDAIEDQIIGGADWWKEQSKDKEGITDDIFRLVGGGAMNIATAISYIPGIKQLGQFEDWVAAQARDLSANIAPDLDPRIAGWLARVGTGIVTDKGIGLVGRGARAGVRLAGRRVVSAIDDLTGLATGVGTAMDVSGGITDTIRRNALGEVVSVNLKGKGSRSRAIKMATEKGRNKEEDDIKDTEIVEDAENTSTGLMSRPAKDYLVADTDEDEIANDALEEDKDIVEEIE